MKPMINANRRNSRYILSGNSDYKGVRIDVSLGEIDEKTKIFITHIDCKGKNHVQLEEYFANINRSYNLIVAYDGLTFTV